MISALVLAAGLSKRMGRPKMLLPWGESTVIAHVVDTLLTAGVTEITVVYGAVAEDVKRALAGRQVRLIYNPDYENGEMLISIQVGLASLPENCEAALIVLGDQPQIQVDVVREVCRAAGEHPEALVIPSYQMRRGHPWVLPRWTWAEVEAISLPRTMRDFMKGFGGEIFYVDVKTPTILMDLDTPEEYDKAVGKRVD